MLDETTIAPQLGDETQCATHACTPDTDPTEMGAPQSVHGAVTASPKQFLPTCAVHARHSARQTATVSYVEYDGSRGLRGSLHTAVPAQQASGVLGE